MLVRSAFIALFVALVSACSGGGEDPATATAQPAATTAPTATSVSAEAESPSPAATATASPTPTPGQETVEDVALALGKRVTVPMALSGPPVAGTFGPTGGVLELGSGASIHVPPGAFLEPTELTVAIFELDHGEELSQARLYSISTVEQIGEIPVPLTLTTPPAIDGGQTLLVLLEEGNWVVQDVAVARETVLTIDHFSRIDAAHLVCGAAGTAIRLDIFELCVQRLLTDFCTQLLDGLSESPDRVLSEDEKDEADRCEFWRQKKTTSAHKGWVDYVVETTRLDWRRAGVDIARSSILSDLELLESCLQEELASGNSLGSALDGCEVLLAAPDPELQPDPEPEPDSKPEQDPEPDPDSQPEPEPKPDHDPDPAPLKPTLSLAGPIVGGISAARTCTSTVGEEFDCPDYSAFFSVAWSGLPSAAAIRCQISGGQAETRNAAAPSGEAPFSLIRERWQFASPPNVSCALVDAGGEPMRDAEGLLIPRLQAPIPAQ